VSPQQACSGRRFALPPPNLSGNGGLPLEPPGVYGTLGIAAAGNVPSMRQSAVGWMDSSGNLWLFGGDGSDSTGALGDLNDLWRYQP